MKIKIVMLVIAICGQAQAYVSNFGSTTGIDMDTYSELNKPTQSVQLNNYARGTMQTVPVRQNGIGGYSSGIQIDYATNKLFQIEVDSMGNTTRWNY